MSGATSPVEPGGGRFFETGHDAYRMVRTVSTDDGEAYRCEECGRVFQAEAEAERHETDCFVPPSM